MIFFSHKKTRAGQTEPDLRPLTADRWSLTSGRRGGFTLMEMMIVITIAAILLGLLAGGYTQALNTAKRARAETQLRELVKAWNEYYIAYPKKQDGTGGWPPSLDGQTDVLMTYDKLKYLFADNNDKGITFLSINIPAAGTYCDPWGNPYKITFKTQTSQQDIALRIAVSFPNRNRYQYQQ